MTWQEAQVYAEENGLFFVETSAKTAVNVNDIFHEIGVYLLHRMHFNVGSKIFHEIGVYLVPGRLRLVQFALHN